MYYYIYKITCTAGSFKNHYYIGQHKTANLDDGYKGSGVKIQSYYKKYPNDYKKEILCWCDSEEDMNVKEDFYVGDLYATDPMCLNLKAGGGNRPGYSDETRKKISENSASRRPEVRKKISEGNKGKYVSKETRKKLSDATKGENNPMYGHKHTKIAKQKMLEASLKGTVGTIWMTNSFKQKRVKSDEVNLYLEKGYSFGRLNKKI